MIELHIKDMTCGHCVQTITRAVKEVDAKAGLKVDLPSQRVEIESSHEPEEFLDAIHEQGYSPLIAEEE